MYSLSRLLITAVEPATGDSLFDSIDNPLKILICLAVELKLRLRLPH